MYQKTKDSKIYILTKSKMKNCQKKDKPEEYNQNLKFFVNFKIKMSKKKKIQF